jgi:UDP-N-acetylglucosamine 4-epimerase
MLIAAKDAKIKRFIFASSSSVYGDSKTLPKVEQHLGEPLSPYAITKRCNEMYACCFANLYEGLEVIGLRYFNVFGRHQDPFSVYAAVIPKFIMAFMNHTAPVINADGNQSRDFTYIENVIEANHLAALTTNKKAINNIFNTACGDRMTLNTLCSYIRELLSKYDPLIASIEPSYGPSRKGDIPHSHASIEKIQQLLGYQVQYDVQSGLKDAIDWYYTQAASWKEEPSLTSTPCLT